MSRRTKWMALLAVIATAAFLIPAAASAGNTRTYEVTISNLTEGQPFTPPLVATHKQPVDLFDVGERASFGLKEVAENGNLSPLEGALEANKHVSNVVVAVAGGPPPLMPGAAVTFTIDGGPGAKWLSYASMLICTNDGFTGADGLRLPKKVGDTVSAGSFAYDAGTEVNTEMFADIVPPCPELTGVDTDVTGSGTSNSALAEGSVITHHDGVVGSLGGDALIASIHDWSTSAPVAMISITRTN